MITWKQDEREVLDYQFDFGGRLGDEGETITSYEVTVSAGLTLGTVSEADGAVTCWLSGGQPGSYYAVVCTVGTDGGRTFVGESVIYIE